MLHAIQFNIERCTEWSDASRAMPSKNVEQLRKLIRKLEKQNVDVAKFLAARKLHLHGVILIEKCLIYSVFKS